MTTAHTPVLLHVTGILPGDSGEAPFVQVDASTPLLHARDLGVVRGEGAFETIGVFDGQIRALDGHLKRLARSARMLDMPAPDLLALEQAVLAAVDLHDDVPDLMVRVFMTAGSEKGLPGAGVPVAWVIAQEAIGYASAIDGLRVLTLDRGISVRAPQDAPWLLAGAKSLSYAINMAATREAVRRGADDALFVSSEGYLLEGPTSTLLVKRGERFSTTPADAGVLPGTSLDSVFAHLRAGGTVCDEVLMTRDDVLGSDGAWLLSSVRCAAPITHLDGHELPVDRDLTQRLANAVSGRG